MPTLRDVAARAGVSTSAVSRTFTPGASVSDAMRARVMEAADALGYRPSTIASMLSTGRSKLIGLVATNFRNPVLLDAFDHFTRGLQARGLRPLLVNLPDDADPAEAIAMLRGYLVDGVIVASSTVPPAFPAAFAAAGIPTVHSFGPVRGSRVHTVGVDDEEAGRIAARALLTRGYRPGVLAGPEGASSSRGRVRGFREICPDGAVHYADAYSFEAGRAAMVQAIGQADGWFCGDDLLSMGALSTLRDAGSSVPGDVGVVGFNDMGMAGWPGIDLTTIRMPVGDIIAGAIELVTALLEDADSALQARLYPLELIERGTLRPA